MTRDNVSSNTSVGGGIGLAGVLGVVFIVLKLVGVINWSWVWVLAPFWIPLAIAVLILVVSVIAIAAVRAAGKDK